MMATAPAPNDGAREASLRRSLFAIHRRAPGASFHSASPQDDDCGCEQKCHTNAHRRGSLATADGDAPPRHRRPASRRRSQGERCERRSTGGRRAPKAERPHSKSMNHVHFSAETSGERTVGRGFRPDYSLGESARHPSHMLPPHSSRRAAAAVEALDRHDFAFVKRSDGSHSYAIVACCTEEYIMLVVNAMGSIKMVSRPHWGEMVRLVSTEGVHRGRLNVRAK